MSGLYHTFYETKFYTISAKTKQHEYLENGRVGLKIKMLEWLIVYGVQVQE